MNYLIKHEDMMCLKMEDNSDHYLFNSLLGIGQISPQSYEDDENEHFSFIPRNKDAQLNSSDQIEPALIVDQLSRIFNLRTTHLKELMNYV